MLCYTISAQEKLDIEGTIKIGHHDASTPEEGTIRFNMHKNDFEGLTDTGWKSMTKRSNSINGTNTVVDIDGNEYRTVNIGNQTWMQENLRTSRLRNGQVIEGQSLPAEWNANHITETPAWSWFHNDPRYENVYGKLYNWYAVGTGKLCPSGWKAPKSSDFETMLNYLASLSASDSDPYTNGDLYKSSHNSHIDELWDEASIASYNYSGFTALPGGIRGGSDFSPEGRFANFWSITDDSGMAYALQLSYNSNNSVVDSHSFGKGNELSVRCLKE